MPNLLLVSTISTITLASAACGGAPANSDPRAVHTVPTDAVSNNGEVVPTGGTIINATPPGGGPGGTVNPNSSAPSTVK